MIITKDLASSISFKLTDKSAKHVESLERKYVNLVRKLYCNQHVPAIIENAFKKHPEFFKTTGNISVTGPGFSTEQVNVKPYVISNTHNWNATLKVQNDEANTAKHLNEIRQEYRKAENAYKKLQEDTRITLLNLRTYKQIAEKMPKAAKYLPSGTLAVAVIVQPLINRLENQPAE
jgi:hypothetical protein